MMGAITEFLERRATWITGGSPQTPQYWVKKLFGVTESKSGIQIDEDIALTYSAVWAAVNIIAGAIGFLPLKTYRRRGDDRELDIRHRAYKLMHDRPNPFMDALTFRETLQGHCLTWGNGYAEIQRDGAFNPLALWPLLPNRVEPQVIDGKTVQYKVTLPDGGTVYLPYINVLHIKGLGFDGIKGYSVIRYSNESIAFGLAAEQYGAGFFGNDSRPGGVLEHPQSLSKEAQERLTESWEAKHQALSKKHRVAILEEGMKWHQIGIPPEEAQFLQTRKFQVADVARWYQIPLHFLSELDKATFSNIEHQGIEFVTFTLARWLKRWELECNYKLLKTAEYPTHFFEFLVDALLRGDIKTRYDAYRLGRIGGFLSINDIRKKENMNTVDGGDTYLEPLNYKPAGEPWPEPKPGSSVSRRLSERELLEHTWERILTKEARALRTAIKKPESFGSRAEEFYGKLAEHLETVFEPVLRGLNLDGDNGFVKKMAGDYVTRHSQAIRKMLDGENRDNLEQRLGNILVGWETLEPLTMADVLMKESESNARL